MNLTEQELRAIEKEAKMEYPNGVFGCLAKREVFALEEIKSWADKADASLPIYEIFGIAVKAINEYNKNSS